MCATRSRSRRSASSPTRTQAAATSPTSARRLVSLRLTEHVDGIGEAEEAALALESVVGSPPRVATPAHLDAVGAATLRLERALGETAASPFAAAMQQARVAVDELALEVETGYKLPLE